MGLWPTVLISVAFPALMLLITVGLGRMEEFLLPHLRTPWPAETDAPPEESRTDQDSPPADHDDRAEDGQPEAEVSRADKIRIAQARADAARRAARRRAYGTPRPARANTGPPRGARTTPLRFR